MRFQHRGIYAIVDTAVSSEVAALTEAVVAAGISIVQLRAKAGVDRDLLHRLLSIAHGAGATLIVNDDIEAGLLADGVHLGIEDSGGIDLAELRRQLAGKILGLSCGTPDEVRAATMLGADYAGAGPIFGTQSKTDAGAPIGVSGVRAVVNAAGIPVVAIGGITVDRIAQVRESGATMAAVISALAGSDPVRSATALIAAWNR